MTIKKDVGTQYNKSHGITMKRYDRGLVPVCSKKEKEKKQKKDAYRDKRKNMCFCTRG